MVPFCYDAFLRVAMIATTAIIAMMTTTTSQFIFFVIGIASR